MDLQRIRALQAGAAPIFAKSASAGIGAGAIGIGPTWQAFELVINLAIVAAAGTVIYTYDASGRLVGADYGVGRSVAYAYDDSGNLLSRTVVGGLPIPIPPNYSVPTRAKMRE